MPYFYLAGAILAEVVATSALKASAEFTKLTPSILVIVGYSVSFYLLAIVLKSIPLGIAYALWSGLGIVLITVVGAVYFKQALDFAAILGIGLIVSGAVILHVFSKTAVY